MFGMTPPTPMKRTTPETMTVSECCNSTVTPSTQGDYTKLDIRKPETLIMSIDYVCNKCGEICRVKEMEIETYREQYSILTSELQASGDGQL